MPKSPAATIRQGILDRVKGKYKVTGGYLTPLAYKIQQKVVPGKEKAWSRLNRIRALSQNGAPNPAFK